MKKIFRKNQIAITSLAIMIAVAGYLNFTKSEVPTIKESSNKEETLDSIDTMDIYQLGDLHIGCKIICKANENWVC